MSIFACLTAGPGLEEAPNQYGKALALSPAVITGEYEACKPHPDLLVRAIFCIFLRATPQDPGAVDSSFISKLT